MEIFNQFLFIIQLEVNSAMITDKDVPILLYHLQNNFVTLLHCYIVCTNKIYFVIHVKQEIRKNLSHLFSYKK